MIPQTILIGIVVAVVGYILQQRAWSHNKREEIRQREFDAATAIVQKLAQEIDKRLYSITVFHSAVRHGAASKSDVDEYLPSIKEWMLNFSAFKSDIFHYFGKSKMEEFESDVHASLRAISDTLLRSHRLGLQNLSAPHLYEHKNLGAKISKARHTCNNFINEMNSMIAAENIGRTAYYNNLSIKKIDYISRIYLIQRLFGLKD